MDVRDCVVCSSAYEARALTSKYCSEACRNRRQRGRTRNWQPAARSCVVCGDSFIYSYSKQRTCGRVCGVELRRREGNLNAPRPQSRTKWPLSRVYFPECIQCGSAFTTRSAHVRVCSTICRSARRVTYWARDKRRQRADPIKRCGCGTAIDRRRHKCDACIEINRRAAQRRKKKADRARHRGIKHEPYTLADIAERDRFKCGLCRRKVNLTLSVPHPKAPTIDHVLPIAVGGDDTRANVQLAHFQCNVRKNTGGSQQLALVG